MVELPEYLEYSLITENVEFCDQNIINSTYICILTLLKDYHTTSGCNLI